MSPKHQTRPDRARSRSYEGALGVLLIAIMLFAWLGLAGVHHGTRTVLHFSLGVALLAIGMLPDRSLHRSGSVVPLAQGSAVLLFAAACGLVVLPHAMLGFLAPGIAEIRKDDSFWTLSLDPESTVGEIADLLLPIGMLIAGAIWASVWWQRRGFERAMRVSLLIVGSVGLLHALAGETSLFGLIDTSLTRPARFFAPFINPNHFGSALVLLLPSALASAGDRHSKRADRLLWGAAAAFAFALILFADSSGALIAAIVSLTLSVWWGHALSPRAKTAVFGCATAVIVPAFLWFDPSLSVTLSDRMSIWLISLRQVPRYWFAGVGGGNFEAAIRPSQTEFAGWAHAHQDGIEWLLEFGLIGVVALVFAVVKLRPKPSSWSTRADALTIGIIGVLVHTLVDFPLQIPAIAMACALVLAVRRAAFEPRLEISPGTVRSIAFGFAALELFASAWEARTTVVGAAVDIVRTEKLGAFGTRATIARLAPWRAELTLLDAWEAERKGQMADAVAHARTAAAEHPDDAYVLRVAARILARAGNSAESSALYDRSIARFPGDWRTWVARAIDSPSEQAIAAWKDAFRAGAPARYLPSAWATMPLGIIWLDIGETREPRFSVILASFLAAHRDYETAALAYELSMIRADELHLEEPPNPGYVRTLIELKRTEEAEHFLAAALAVNPSDARLQKMNAELLEDRGQHAEAADIWLSLANNNPIYLVNALRATESAEGPSAAVKLAEQRGLIGQRRLPVVVLELARIQRDMGQKSLCATALHGSNLLGDPEFGPRARQLLGTCE